MPVGVVGGQPPADFGLRLMDAFRRSLSFPTFSSDTVPGTDRRALRSSQFDDAAKGDLRTVFGRIVLAP